MNRTFRSAFAILVGFVGATAAFAAIENDRTSDRKELGKLDVIDHCQSEYGIRSAAMVLGRNAWAWRCTFLSNGIFEELSLDFNGACQAQFDDKRAFASPLDTEDPNSWWCFIGG
jgi:hypothetical protein